MTIETLNERIANAKASIAKKINICEKKNFLIKKKEAMIYKLGFDPKLDKDELAKENKEVFWIACDIDNLKDDIIRLQKEIEDTQNSLKNYQTELNIMIEKEGNRNIQIIIDFLKNWKEKVINYYHEAFEKYLIEKIEYYQKNHIYVEWSNNSGWKTKKENPEEYRRIKDEYKEYENFFNKKWKFITPFIERGTGAWNTKEHFIFNDKKFKKMLDEDAKAKYDFIVDRTTELVGHIIDATNLHISNKGDLNGFNIGERGKVKVETIDAGGYNIQCAHFRTLIHKLN